jgi:putative ABC transport system substrate-binding protein
MDRVRGCLSRRQLVVGAAASSAVLLAACGRLPWQAAPPARMPRVGYLSPGSKSEEQLIAEPFDQALRESGWIDGQNIAVEWRYADLQQEQFPKLAAELVAIPVDVLVAIGLTIAPAAQATATIPIVMINAGDPVGTGLVASLAHPGGHITGLSTMTTELGGKRMDLIHTAFPNVARVALILPITGSSGSLERAAREAARTLGLHLDVLAVNGPADFDAAFEAALREGAEALLVGGGILALTHRTAIADFAMRQRLPAMYDRTEFVTAGGLMSYGPGQPATFRRAAYYVDRILRGAKPADLPVEQPMTFDFVVNLKTAQALGIAFPNEIMLQVTEVIQ